MSAPALELEHVWLARQGQPLLCDVSLRVERGEFVALLGPNGSGKTTLLHLLLGRLAPQRGNVRVLGQTPQAARGRVGYVPQHVHFDLDFPIRVIDVVLMGRLARGRLGIRFGARDRAIAQAVLERMEIAPLARRPIGQLSSGERQRVLIARALAAEPELLLLDEPTASLDERIGRDFHELLEELLREITVVMVSHDVAAVAQRVDRVACLNRRLFVHAPSELTPEILEAMYAGPVTLLPPHEHRGK